MLPNEDIPLCAGSLLKTEYYNFHFKKWLALFNYIRTVAFCLPHSHVVATLV